jgi:hypothetical protein
LTRRARAATSRRRSSRSTRRKTRARSHDAAACDGSPGDVRRPILLLFGADARCC